VVRGTRSAHQPYRLELPTPEIPVVVVQYFIISHEYVSLAIAIEVEDDHAECFPVGCEPGGLGHVGECSVPVVPEQVTACAGEVLGTARVAHVAIWAGFDAVRVLFRIEAEISAHKQVKVAVPVNIPKRTTRAPAIEHQSGFFGHVPEPSAALAIGFVVVQATAIEVTDEQIGKAIVVVVTNGDTLSVAGRIDSHFCGDVHKRTIATVAV
jgi:hypothetical protein